ncbi:MAG: protein-L-isoaspartate O-methyltransferase, partial [Fulvivirga sp.]|nr:protein-L-isoaspartate O-methyltransferase [Fulvivirga sp.]
QAAILAQLVDHVYTIEIVKPLAKSSKQLLQELGYDNVTVKWGDGYQGWPEHAPFDAIILTAAPPETPPALIAQLKPGGKMILPEGEYYQQLKLITKRADGSIKVENKGAVRFVPMVEPKDTLDR